MKKIDSISFDFRGWFRCKANSKGTFHAFLDVNVGKEFCVLDVAEATHLRDYLTQELKRRERRLKSGK